MGFAGELGYGNLIFLPFLFLLLSFVWRAVTASTRADVPVVGSTAFFGYKTALKLTSDYRRYLAEGYYKYKGHAFQIPGLRAWTVVVSGKFIDELRKAPEDTVSFREEVNDSFSIEYTIGKSIADDQWHLSVVRKQMTSNLAEVFPGVYDEINQAFDDEVKLPSDGEWTSIHAYDVIVRVICRATNRMFVGVPLCRDPVYTQISRDFTLTLAKAGFFISIFPTFLKPFAARFLTRAPKAMREFEPFIIPLIKERERLAAEFGDDWHDKPNDLLQWMMDAAEGDQYSHKDLTLRVLATNFAAIHTSSSSFAHAFYYLAANPQFAPPLREEVEAAVNEHGWTKDALNSMIKVDSFLRESTRITPMAASIMNRKVLKTFTFSDGTVLPAGSHVCANLYSVHHDPSIYPDPYTFDPFRFSRRVEEGEESQEKNLFITTGTEYLTWGHGSHACPGRFFASQELKAMLAHIVLHYDVRMPEDGVRAPDTWFVQNCIPNRTAQVLFRKRQL